MYSVGLYYIFLMITVTATTKHSLGQLNLHRNTFLIIESDQVCA